jgi:transposase-like protein
VGAAAAKVVSVLRVADRRRLLRTAKRHAREERELRDQHHRELRQLVRELRAGDATVIELAHALGVSRQTIYNWLKS